MLKRILAVLLCVFMLASVLPFSAYAATETTQTENEQEAARIRNEIMRMYYRVLYASGQSSLHGFCGLMSSYQLWQLGINPYPIVYNGNDHYDAYKDKDVTLGGYAVKAYSAKNYTLEEALNTVSENGTKNVYNILVGFQWTNTEAGRIYGHSMVINAIIDGVVYFSEGYASEFNYNPGMPCVATIEKFASSYNSWASFEGIILFGRKEYTDFCTEYPTHLFIEATDVLHTMTLPSTADGEYLRQVAVGERLEATAVYENADGELFYRVEDCGNVSYVLGKDTKVVCFNNEDVTAADASIPTQLSVGQGFNISGHIRSQESWLGDVEFKVTDANGEDVIAKSFSKTGKSVQMGARYINDSVSFRSLQQGVYTYGIYADVMNYYIDGEEVALEESNVCVVSAPFAVGTELDETQAAFTSAKPAAEKDGWEYVDGKWRYYDEGKMRTGWFCYNDIDYYLLEDGSAASGWYTINGKNRYFTSTGAMRTGWLRTDAGVYYMLFNGAAAIGERVIDGATYTFDETGLLITE